MSYEMIDHFLRNNLDDEDYAEYSAALDSICAPSAPDVVKQLVEALQSTEMFLDYVYNQDIDSLSFNKLMTQIIVVEQALAAAEEAGYEG